MSYDAALLSSEPIYRIRFRLQDIWEFEEDEFLQDAEYQFLIDSNNGNEDAATLAAARRILARAAQYVREREGLVEVYANQVFDNLKDLIDELEKELVSVGGAVIIGGVVGSEVERVENDFESVGPGYGQDYLFKDIDITYGGGSRATGFRGSRNRDSVPGFRIRSRSRGR